MKKVENLPNKAIQINYISGQPLPPSYSNHQIATIFVDDHQTKFTVFFT